MAETKNAVAENKFETKLSYVTDQYMGVIERQMQEGGAEFDQYSAKCVVAALGSINTMLHNNGSDISKINTSNMNDLLIKVASMKLNANASPRECYFQVRNVNVAGKGKKEQWEKQIEMGIEGDGNDALLSRFGRDVKKVCQHWEVREQDMFKFPMYNGLEMTAPQWQPTGQGKVIRVVYPIIKTDNSVEYYFAERKDVVRNLIAHISNNLMNETFGIVKSRYDADNKQKAEIDAKKKEIMDKVKSLGDLDTILDCEEFAKWISPAWREPQSREQMIVRKMRNNITKKIPKDFDSSIAANSFNMMDDTYREVHAEIEQNENSVVYTMDEADVHERPADDDPTETATEPQTEESTEPNTPPETEKKAEPTPEDDGLPAEFPM